MTSVTEPAPAGVHEEVLAELLADRAALSATLDRFAAAFTALSRLLVGAPDQTLVERVRDAELLADWPVAGADSDRGTALLAESRVAHEDVDQIRRDYNRLFFGPERMIAPPYESVYRSDEGLVFERETMQVRAAYAAFGLTAPRLNREPDDHIALELSFLGTVCVRALDASEAGDDGALRDAVAAVQSFLAEHLLVWGPDCLRRAAAGSKTFFFQGVAAMGLGTLAQAGDAFLHRS